MQTAYKRQFFNIENWARSLRRKTGGFSHRNALDRGHQIILWLVLALFSTACTEGFEPFNQVDRFRILSLKADPPDLTEGEFTTITPLVHIEGDAPVHYKWSWCPIAASAKNGGACVVDEAMIKDLAEQLVAEQVGEDAASLIQDFPFSFDLGEGPFASFVYAMPRQMLSDLCDRLISDGIPSFTGIPQCKTSFDVVIRLEATSGDTTLLATKKIPLYVDESRAGNENPDILDVTLKDEKGRVVTDTVRSGEWYDLKADIPKESVDMLLPLPTAENEHPKPREETLFMTWYVTGGETEYQRTTYIEDEVSMKVLRTNRWRIPHKSDVDDGRVQLYLVLQDEQGGASWLSREFTVKEGSK